MSCFATAKTSLYNCSERAASCSPGFLVRQRPPGPTRAGTGSERSWPRRLSDSPAAENRSRTEMNVVDPAISPPWRNLVQVIAQEGRLHDVGGVRPSNVHLHARVAVLEKVGPKSLAGKAVESANPVSNPSSVSNSTRKVVPPPPVPR